MPRDEVDLLFTNILLSKEKLPLPSVLVECPHCGAVCDRVKGPVQTCWFCSHDWPTPPEPQPSGGPMHYLVPAIDGLDNPCAPLEPEYGGHWWGGNPHGVEPPGHFPEDEEER